MSKEELENLLNLRQKVLEKFIKLKDYKNNKNAIMKELDHALVLSDVITSIDNILKEYVNFSDKK